MPADCETNPFCLPGLKSKYNLDLSGGFQALETSAIASALDAGAIDVALLFSTDGRIVANNYVLLQDDKHMLAADNVIPVAKKDAEVHYSVSSDGHVSPDAVFRSHPTDVLRVAVVANWQGKPNLKAPAPRQADGKPDFIGFWQPDRQRECTPDLACHLVDVGFRQPSAVTDAGEDAFETIGQGVEQGGSG